jgi:hypothetical protein
VVAFLGTRLVEQTAAFVAFLSAVVAADRTESGVAVGQTRSAVGLHDCIQGGELVLWGPPLECTPGEGPGVLPAPGPSKPTSHTHLVVETTGTVPGQTLRMEGNLVGMMTRD